MQQASGAFGKNFGHKEDRGGGAGSREKDDAREKSVQKCDEYQARERVEHRAEKLKKDEQCERGTNEMPESVACERNEDRADGEGPVTIVRRMTSMEREGAD